MIGNFRNKKVLIVSDDGQVRSFFLTSFMQKLTAFSIVALLVYFALGFILFLNNKKLLEKEKRFAQTQIVENKKMSEQIESAIRHLQIYDNYFGEGSESQELPKNESSMSLTERAGFLIKKINNKINSRFTSAVKTLNAIIKVIPGWKNRVMDGSAKQLGHSLSLATNSHIGGPLFNALNKKEEEDLKSSNSIFDAAEEKNINIPMDDIFVASGFNNDFSNYSIEERIKILSFTENILNKIPLGQPVKFANITSWFGYRKDPFYSSYALHSGIDFVSHPQAPIYATADGTVEIAQYKGSYGKLIVIEHVDNLSTYYAHLSKILVKNGQQIKRGDIIGWQGNTGRSTGPHLHYEVRHFDRAIDPSDFINYQTS